MLYLAEVQKQKGGLLGGGGRAELKLLACQRTDQSWSNVSEEVIATDEANKFSDGALVLVELTPSKQVQRLQDAGRPLVNILQNFSRQVEKFKVKEEEIDQWKQSLTFQAQELNRREMDLEVRLEQLQQMEEDFERLEAQRIEVETSRDEIERRREEIERHRQELEGAWDHLRGEQRRLEEYKSEVGQGTVLDEEKSRNLQELLEQLSGGVTSTDGMGEHINQLWELINCQQEVLNPHWQQLQEQSVAAQQQQEDVERQTAVWQNRQAEWQQAQASLEQARAELKVQTANLNSKQEYAQMLSLVLRNQEELYQQAFRVAETSTNVTISQKVDVEALERMPIADLQKTIQDLQRKLQIDRSFVNDQEQELQFQQGAIDELQGRINLAAESERLNLETELAEEQDRYQMLYETLVGQRRILREQEEYLNQHQIFLMRRQGNPPAHHGQDEEKIIVDLGPILAQIDGQRQQKSEELQRLEREIEQTRVTIGQAQAMIDVQSRDQEAKRQELQAMEQHLMSLGTAAAQCWARVNLYQETLQPIQDCLDGIRNCVEVMSSTVGQAQENGNNQLQRTIEQMRETFTQSRFF